MSDSLANRKVLCEDESFHPSFRRNTSATETMNRTLTALMLTLDDEKDVTKTLTGTGRQFENDTSIPLQCSATTNVNA